MNMRITLIFGFLLALSGACAAAPAPMPAGLVSAMTVTFAKAAAHDPAYAIGHDGCARLGSGRKALQGCFGRQGPRFRSGQAQISLRLAAFGRAGDLHPVQLHRTRPRANQIDYRGNGLTEWWRVLPTGYEQGFTVTKAPAGKGEVVLALRASAAPVVTGKTLRWGNVYYGRLRVIDAAGRLLPSRLSVHGRSLRLAFDGRGARFPVTVDPTVWTQEQELAASDGAASDAFGTSVALSADGTTALVVAISKSVGGIVRQGAAYIFTKSGGAWSQVAELTSSDGATNDFFGSSAALSADGSIALVGDRRKNSEQGAAYLFTEPAGGWVTATETAKLTASDGLSGDEFGGSVALSADGSTALVGAYGKEISTIYPGAAYLFTEPAGGWVTATQNAEFTASDSATGDDFGISVALSADGSTALIGAAGKNSYQGAAYVFTGSGGSLSQTAELTASDGVANDWFGQAVALSADGTTALVGADQAPYDSSTSTNGPGAAYLFTEPAAGWATALPTTLKQTAELTTSNPASNDFFGVSVALSTDGSSALVGASGKGAVDLFTEPAAGWATTLPTTLSENDELTASDGASGDGFGVSVALSTDGSAALVGAYNKSVGGNTGQGVAYYFSNASSSSSGGGALDPWALLLLAGLAVGVRGFGRRGGKTPAI